jgi:CheY-like chemotaxis protein
MRRIRPDIPVILASGYNEAHVLKGEHADLPQAILEKPYQIQQLIAAIQKIIDSQHA